MTHYNSENRDSSHPHSATSLQMFSQEMLAVFKKSESFRVTGDVLF